MNESIVPTPYADVNVVVRDLTRQIQAILGNHFLGLYLYGSLALGDFDPHTSDIDFIVVTDMDIADDDFVALRETHTQFDRSNSPWSRKVEIAYIPKEALYHSIPTSAIYPQLEKGTALLRAPLESGWAFQLHTLREYGVVVAGPEPRTLIHPVHPADMRQAASMILRKWLEQSCHDSAWIAWARFRKNQAFIVLTLCRFLYHLETGGVASKPAAARWAQKNFKTQWKDLIEQSLAGQHSDQETMEEDFNAMLALLSHTLERSPRNQ